eukprot:336639_1
MSLQATVESSALMLLKEQINVLNNECQQFQTQMKRLFGEIDVNKSIQDRFSRLCNNYSVSLNRICIGYLIKFESDSSLLTSSNPSPIEPITAPTQTSSVKTEYTSSPNTTPPITTTNNQDTIDKSPSILPVPDLDPAFTCNICNKSFKNESGLAEHNHLHHTKSTKIYKCKVCDESFSSPSALGGHMNKHRDKSNGASGQNIRMHKCEVCSEAFSSGSALGGHMNKHRKKTNTKSVIYNDNPRKHRCHYDDCNASFTERKYLLHHIREIHDGSPWNCMDCDEKFKYFKDLNRHRNSMHSSIQQNTFKCVTCRMQFASKDLLNAHKLTHASSVACELCSSSFKSIESMRAHLVGIHQVNPWKCDECNQRFRFKRELKIHKVDAHCKSEINEETLSMDECMTNNDRYLNKDEFDKLFDLKMGEGDIVIKQSRKKSLFNRRL